MKIISVRQVLQEHKTVSLGGTLHIRLQITWVAIKFDKSQDCVIKFRMKITCDCKRAVLRLVLRNSMRASCFASRISSSPLSFPETVTWNYGFRFSNLCADFLDAINHMFSENDLHLSHLLESVFTVVKISTIFVQCVRDTFILRTNTNRF